MTNGAVTLAGSPPVRLTATGVAYRVVGAGYPDLLLIPDGVLPMAALAQFPQYAHFLEQLAAVGRLIVFDRRGIGASREARPDRWRLQDWADDAGVVLDAAGSRRAVIVAIAEGAMTAVTLAVRHPARVAGLVLVNATPGPSLVPLSRRGAGASHIDRLRSSLSSGWLAKPPGVALLAPSVGRDRTFTAWLSDAFRQAGDARRFLPAFDLALRSDVHGHLAAVRAPTLVVHRRANGWFSTDHGRTLASGIDGARYLELPGADHAPYVGQTRDLLDAIRAFVAELIPTASHGLAPAARARVTPRQAEVLALVRSGLGDKEIAARLGVSERTVQKHLEHSYRRLRVANRTAAALTAGGGGAPLTPRAQGGPLTHRECELLELVARGLVNKQIAAELGIATATVKKHLEHVYAKLGVHTRTGALARAREASGARY